MGDDTCKHPRGVDLETGGCMDCGHWCPVCEDLTKCPGSHTLVVDGVWTDVRARELALVRRALEAAAKEAEKCCNCDPVWAKYKRKDPACNAHDIADVIDQIPPESLLEEP